MKNNIVILILVLWTWCCTTSTLIEAYSYHYNESINKNSNNSNKQIQQQHQYVSKEQIRLFQRDGYIVIKGLLNSKLIDQLLRVKSSKNNTTATNSTSSNQYFTTTQSNAIFKQDDDNNDDDDHYSKNSSKLSVQTLYRQIAMYSKIPQIVAELMQLNPIKHNLRILRDVYLERDIYDNTKTCGWHVDDIGFWPTTNAAESSSSIDDGINVWIALDDMPYGGSMAISPGSHNVNATSWRREAIEAIGQQKYNIGLSKEQVKQNVQKQLQNNSYTYLTCDMHINNPKLYETIEQTGITLKLQRGDIIFATKNLFHKTTSVSQKGIQYYQKLNNDNNSNNLLLRRYSIRYVPGYTKLYNGWNVEWSVLHNPNNTGKALDEIINNNQKQQDRGSKMNNDNIDTTGFYNFYPKVWPIADKSNTLDLISMNSNKWTQLAKQQVQELFLLPTTTKIEPVTTQ